MQLDIKSSLQDLEYFQDGWQLDNAMLGKLVCEMGLSSDVVF